MRSSDNITLDPSRPAAEPPRVLLTHFKLCPFSRSIRLALVELRHAIDLAEERPWEWRTEFLSLNPAGELPVLDLGNGSVLCGSYAISEYLAEVPTIQDPEDAPPVQLFPGDADARAEVRRLVDWFHGKLDREVTQELLSEKIYGRLDPRRAHTADADVLRAARVNLRYHLTYVGHLATQRNWLAGEALSFADLAAGAQFSVIDYLGEVPWDEHPAAKSWYARLKSRPAFRSILADRMPGMSPPAAYSDLDF